MKPISAEIMSEIDRKAQDDFGIAQVVLMENAGRSAAEVILADTASIKDEKIAIFCGKGNNGGDGFVVGRYLANKAPGRLTIYVADMERIRPGAARDNFEIVQKMGLDLRPIGDFLVSGDVDFTIGVDSIFGTGFKDRLPEEYAAVGRRLNSSTVRIYAIDVPSGLDATTGVMSKGCFKADKTITFALPKQGFYVNDGPSVCGEVIIRDIGFPMALLESYL
ncbi:MAG: NAD(P)H-hydrate epimerase [Candidatus Omnitrophota bacterium]|nr:NAD(P)H-hydrate epimerase [Candidatus Omnitrophota bacterium]